MPDTQAPPDPDSQASAVPDLTPAPARPKDRTQREAIIAFATGLALGKTNMAAALAADYKRLTPSRVNKAAKSPTVQWHVAEIRHELARQARDVTADVETLRKWATKAGNNDSASALLTAKTLLIEAVRLRNVTAEALSKSPAAQVEPEMTEEEWLAAYVPKRDEASQGAFPEASREPSA